MLHLDTGNTAFMLLCASLVMLMTPGLAFFYGGLVGRKNVLAIMMQSFVSMGWTTVLWWAFGFSLCFSGDQKSGDYQQLCFHCFFLKANLEAPRALRLALKKVKMLRDIACAFAVHASSVTPWSS